MAGPKPQLRACVLSALIGVLCLPAAARAQDPAAGAAVPKAAPAKPQAQKAAGAAATPASDSGLKQRVESLEEQLVDMQVVIGTLESMSRSGGGAQAPAFRPAPAGGADAARIESLETQVRALAAQVEQLSAEVRQQGSAGRRSETGAMPPPPMDGNVTTSRFGSTTVDSTSTDAIGGLISEETAAKSGTALPDISAPGSGPAQAAPGQMAAVAPAGEAKQVYEQAYGSLLQQDYGAAQAGFGEFLKKFPKDPLAPNALYWLGETHYVQKNYADAAEAFDLVTAAYAGSAKAPDAQLKRAMSLSQLGKRDQSCAAFKQLNAKYPNAPAHVKTRADSERQRLGCG